MARAFCQEQFHFGVKAERPELPHVPFKNHVKDDAVERVVSTGVGESRRAQHTDNATALFPQEFLRHARLTRLIKIAVIAAQHEHKRRMRCLFKLVNREVIENCLVCPDDASAVSGILRDDGTFAERINNAIFGDALR